MGPDNREEEHEMMREGERDEAEPETRRRAQSTAALCDKVPRARIARAPTLLRPCRLLRPIGTPVSLTFNLACCG